MTDTADTAAREAQRRSAGIREALRGWLAALGRAIPHALEKEAEERRLFLWLPVAMGAGVVLYFVADREPSLPFCGSLAIAFASFAVFARRHRRVLFCLIGAAAVFVGMTTAGWRTARLAAPVLDRIRIASVQGYIEEMDFRRAGARFVLRVSATDALDDDKTPYRVRLTTRTTPAVEAGAYVEVKARLLPPSRAAEPGGYDFARDAWYMRIGAVGSVLGRVKRADAPEPPDLWLRIGMAIDRVRNALARRVDGVIGGDAGAIAAAMVTGKRDLLSEDAKTLIREAGIFHVITISGVQMTLVAGIFFVGLRRLLGLSRHMALNYPIKKIAAAAAIVAAVIYDIMTGSRVGTERALVMTLIMLVAVLLDRQALTMRNLALAAIAILTFEPEALLGASFQLSFAAVAALVAVYESRTAAYVRKSADGIAMPSRQAARRSWFHRRNTHGLANALFATFCATSATASFMAYDFHEVNPYVLLGNPLTLTIIEVFAVPGAILGTILYPLGLDAIVWHWVGFGISMIMAAAHFIGSLPGSTIHLPSFAPWSLVVLSLAVLSAVIWQTTLLRATAVPLAMIGLGGAVSGPTFDVVAAPLGDAVAVRQADGRLAVIGRRPSDFAAEQWLRADADGRAAKTVVRTDACDKIGCVAKLSDGRNVALVLDQAAFAEDCERAAVVVTPLFAPTGCAASVVIDRESQRRTGAVALKLESDGRLTERADRGPDEDRPWSPKLRAHWTYRPDVESGRAGSAEISTGE